MKSTSKIWATLIVIGIIAIGSLYVALNRSSSLGGEGDIITVAQKFVKGFFVGKANSSGVYPFRIDQNGIPYVTNSPDGFVANASFTVATGTAKAVYTNSTGSNLMCSDESGAVYTTATGFSQGLAVAIGTSTTATGYSANLLASTTMATTTASTATTQAVDVTYAAPFILANGESITASLSDVVSNASTTYNGRRSIEFGFHCWTLGVATQ